MSKEKKRNEDGEKKDLTFYYEIVGIITILLSTITLARLGNSGKWLMVFFKLLFGDWYFLILLLLMLYGFRSLLYHRPMEVKTMRFMGIIIFLIGLFTISHFPMHNYIDKLGGNHLQLTINIYAHYLKYFSDDAVLGGGIIGGSFFYLFYFLFGSVGAVIIAGFLMVIGFAFILKKTLKEFSTDLIKIAKGGFRKSKSFFHTLKYDIAQNPSLKSKGKTHQKKNRYRLPLKILTEVTDNFNAHYEEQNASNTRRTIMAILNHMNIFFRDVSFYVSYHITTLIVDTKMSIDLDLFCVKLKEVLEKPFLIKKDNVTHQITIEVNNTYSQTINLKKALLSQTNLYNNYMLALGFNYQKDLIESNLLIQSSLLVIGEEESNIINFVKAITFSLFFKNLPDSFTLTIIDQKNQMLDLQDMNEYKNDLSQVLLTLKAHTEDILEKMSSYGVNNIEEYNRLPQIDSPISYQVIILAGLEKVVNDVKLLDEVIYLMHIGKKCGLMVIASLTEDLKLPPRLASLFDEKIIFWNRFLLSTEILGFDGASKLEKSNDAFYMRKVEIMRIAPTMIDYMELKRILKEI